MPRIGHRPVWRVQSEYIIKRRCCKEKARSETERANWCRFLNLGLGAVLSTAIQNGCFRP